MVVEFDGILISSLLPDDDTVDDVFKILLFGLISSKLTPLVSGTKAKLNRKPKAAKMA